MQVLEGLADCTWMPHADELCVIMRTVQPLVAMLFDCTVVCGYVPRMGCLAILLM